MFACPGCAAPLERVESDGPRYWACRRCGGRALTVGALRRSLPVDFVEQALAATEAGGWRGRRRCPLCTMHMVGRRVKHGGHEYGLDHCDRGSLLWFDPGEHEAAAGGAAPPPPDPDHEAPGRPRLWSGGPGQDDFVADDDLPTSHWTDAALALGLPAPEGDALWSRPWATWILAGAIAAASLLAFAAGGTATVREFALHPSDPFRLGGFEWISSFLLHWDFWHLASNLYFFLMFGVCVEDVLRPVKFLLLVALSKVAGSLLYLALSAGEGGPSAGASGGIAGILAYWALAFPHARVRMLLFGWGRRFGEWMQPWTFSLSSRAALGLWIALQAWGAIGQVSGIGGVNYLAHLGGIAAGAAFWAFGPEGPWARFAEGATIRRSPPPRGA